MISGFFSEKGFEELYLHAVMIAQYSNPQLFYNLREMPDAERLAELTKLIEEMKELIN